MKKLRLMLILVAAVWLVGEFVLVSLAESRLEERVAEEIRDAAGVGADIGTFPSVTRLLVTGRVPRVAVTLDDISRQGVQFAEVRFELNGVHVDRAAMLRRDPRVTAIERGTVTASIDLGAISSILGRVASFIGADIRVSGRNLQIAGDAFPLSRDILPCDPEARLAGDRVVVSCSIDDVPQILLEAVQARP